MKRLWRGKNLNYLKKEGNYMYQYKWFNYYKGRYVNVIRVEVISKEEVQICDEDGDWYNVKIHELQH